MVIAQTEEEAEAAVREMMEGRAFGSAGTTVVIEEFMEGEEASVLAFCDGKTIIPMISSQDHKRIRDNDEGPNTGGMGAYAPAPVMTDELMKTVRETILQPACDAMAAEGYPFVGCLYAGLMITAEGPKVVEFNCRFGDPETEVVLPMLDSDLAEIMMHCVNGTLSEEDVRWKDGYAVDVVLASEGYPQDIRTAMSSPASKRRKSWDATFSMQARKRSGSFVTNGGRVLNVVARGATLKEARDKAYEGVSAIRWRGMQYRHDIAAKGLKHLENK